VDLFFVNAMLVIFNSIPAFPMDGGRVLRALLATQMPHARATLIAARVGQGIAVLFGIWGVSSGNFILVFIAVFVFIGAKQELTYVQMRSATRDLRVGQVMITQFRTLPLMLRVEEIPTLLSLDDQGVFPMVDDSLRLRGIVSREELIQASRELPRESLANCVARQIPVVRPDTKLEEALELMQRLAEPVLPVVNLSGQIVGLASRAFPR
jgi:stage IV sporulation protein FB